MNPLILFHWLVKGHNQTVTEKEAGCGGALSKPGEMPGVK